jgi:hypothetical protein
MNPKEVSENQAFQCSHQHGHQQSANEEVPADAIDAWFEICPQVLPAYIRAAMRGLLKSV